jgi:hypothetical protein
MNNKPIDPVDIKNAISKGQLEVFASNRVIYIRDTETGDCVKIGEVSATAEMLARLRR